MAIALVIVATAYLAIGGLVALNSVLEAERGHLAAKDVLIIALVGAAWPAIGCALLSIQPCRRLVLHKRELLHTVR